MFCLHCGKCEAYFDNTLCRATWKPSLDQEFTLLALKVKVSLSLTCSRVNLIAYLALSSKNLYLRTCNIFHLHTRCNIPDKRAGH